MKKKLTLIISAFALCAVLLSSCSITDRTPDSDPGLLVLSKLKQKYPDYFGLSTFKGLEVYVWQMAENSYSFGVLSGTNRIKSPKELLALKGAKAQEMKVILASYNIDESMVLIIPLQHPLSSYLPDYWIDFKDEDEETRAKRKQEYIDNIRRMLFGHEAGPGS